ncbi:hypothetical protein L3X38_016710 [Prunus dulcis]|uniref:Uncharacterized protein n=1 Tax=Prunus dulcis TaxID=3755 RepID=A0AAD4W5X8_PRUDU|nr:hypothetical protein L3X38_016710 [Prunus dulcis]
MKKVKARTRTIKPNPENATPISSSPTPIPTYPHTHHLDPPVQGSGWMSQTKYIKAKWLSPHTRATSSSSDSMTEEKTQPLIETAEFELIQGGTNSAGETELEESVFELLESSGEEENAIMEKEWKPPELKPKRSQTRVKMVTAWLEICTHKCENRGSLEQRTEKQGVRQGKKKGT